MVGARGPLWDHGLGWGRGRSVDQRAWPNSGRGQCRGGAEFILGAGPFWRPNGCDQGGGRGVEGGPAGASSARPGPRPRPRPLVPSFPGWQAAAAHGRIGGAAAPTPRGLPGRPLPFVFLGGDERKTRAEAAGARTPALLATSRASGRKPASALPRSGTKGCGLGSGRRALRGGAARPRGSGCAPWGCTFGLRLCSGAVRREVRGRPETLGPPRGAVRSSRRVRSARPTWAGDRRLLLGHGPGAQPSPGLRVPHCAAGQARHPLGRGPRAAVPWGRGDSRGGSAGNSTWHSA